MLEVSSYFHINSANFSGEKKITMKLSGVSIFWEYANKALS